ncbi:hypothetical protein GCM10025868_27540 [Angustibacter aerolatus]|uniref:Uncharacterized protein n=1 Tax=Angustibacter aerolatus TaxID=1162965 RepID=A0ABQ6JJF6_9ACTN|nr:hypothetical protein [Angustibacter aerolatus]GMA87504.1 hypothetical protein GCM10025868_27540 [Angustibacter aerolatus]
MPELANAIVKAIGTAVLFYVLVLLPGVFGAVPDILSTVLALLIAVAAVWWIPALVRNRRARRTAQQSPALTP